MSGEDNQDLAQVRRLEELIGMLDAHADSPAKEAARELVSLVLDLHGIGLAKLMAVLAAAEDSASILARLVDDNQVRSMLLLHGLHPDDMETRVRRAVERLRPHLGVHGLRLDVEEVVRGRVRLRVQQGGEPVKGTLLLTLPNEIEDAIVDAAPDVEEVVIDGLGLPGASAAIHAAE